MKKILSFALLAFLAWGCTQKSPPAPKAVTSYEANWESIKQYQIPEWFKDAKLGIFIHWGPYSVPAYGSEWYPRLMYHSEQQYTTHGVVTKEEPHPVYLHHVETYGPVRKFGYKDFIPMFTAEKFDAEEWISLFKEAGARYVVPVAEHHDAFAMYNSSYTDWNSVKMGPKRDVLGELKAAATQQGLYFGASSHFAYNWVYFHKKPGFDTMNRDWGDLYGKNREAYVEASREFLELWWNRTTEIIDKYEPDIMWFDFYIDNEEFIPYHPKLAAYYYNKGLEWDREVVLQTKNMFLESFPEGSNVLDIERGKLSKIRKFFWQTDTSVGENSWGYVSNWISKKPNTLVDDLIDIVSKNGCMLLNVGPTKEGIIPDDQQEVLRALGAWLMVNGEGIYESRPWTVFGEGPTVVEEGHHSEGGNEDMTAQDFRFTQKDGDIYAYCLDVALVPDLLIRSLHPDNGLEAGKIKSVSLLSNGEKLDWEMTSEGLKLTVDEWPEDLKYAVGFKIHMK